MKIENAFTLAAPPDDVARVFCSEAYYEQESRERQDVQSHTYRKLNETERELAFEIAYQEYRRTKTGRIDRGGTVPTRVSYRYDVPGRVLSWTYQGQGGDRFGISGSYRLQPNGGGTRVLVQADIEVRVPLVGKQIAKLAAREYKKDMPRVERLLSRLTAG
jgi:carbon monoxide dehydrogenase subunit G